MAEDTSDRAASSHQNLAANPTTSIYYASSSPSNPQDHQQSTTNNAHRIGNLYNSNISLHPHSTSYTATTSATANQASIIDLEDTPDAVTLPAIEKLKGREDFGLFMGQIKNTLSMYDLQRLPDISWPRPPQSDPKYKTWRRNPKAIKVWTYNHLPARLRQEIEMNRTEVTYAVEFVQLLQHQVFGTGSNMASETWLDAIYIKRSDFANIEDFVHTIQERVDQSNAIKMHITAYQAILVMLRQLEPELTVWDQTARNEFIGRDPDTISMSEFINLTKMAKDQAMLVPMPMYAAINTPSKKMPNPNNNNYTNSPNARTLKSNPPNNNNNESGGKSDRPRNSPPSGMGPQEWARMIRESHQQRNKKGRLRTLPEEWKPRGNVWYLWGRGTGLPPKNHSNLAAAVNQVSTEDAFDFSFSGMAMSTTQNSTFPNDRHPILAGTAASNTLITDKQDIMDYKPIPPNDITYRYATSGAELSNPTGMGKYRLRLVDPEGRINEYRKLTVCHPQFLEAILPYAEAVSKHLPDKQRRVHIKSATAFLYLFLSLGSPDSPGFIYTLRSTIPIGAGLGSSASVCVCLSTALLLQIRALAGPHPDQPIEEADTQIEHINRWAFVGELCIHGDPSGIDNTVSAGGKAVMFQRNNSGHPSVIRLPKFPRLPLLLVDTQQSRSTSLQVEKVKTLKASHREVTHVILDGIGKVATSALELISSAKFNGSGFSDALEHLGTLISVNHGLLVSLGVSHPRLERIRELVDYANIGWTKLTGAGGGGCAITLFRPDIEERTIKELERKFSAEGFTKYETTLGADGVGVLWPAFLPNSIDRKAGKEIDQEMFANADGVQGLDQLVGVGVQENREGWKFWMREIG